MYKRTNRVILIFLLLIVNVSLLFSQTPRVAEWAKSAVWYQIFPERFCNGDPSNDPDVNSLNDTWPYELPENWAVMPWNGQWYKMADWETRESNMQQRRYGGDLQGVIDKLDYLKDLGVNAIYLNPIFESPSLHKYGCSMYRHIDNNFGPDPKGDENIWNAENPIDPATWQWTSSDKLFLNLIDECHKRNMKIIIDGVFNHTGIPFWAFQDIKKNGADSKYADWFVVNSYDDPATPENEFDYDGWYGVKDLPEIMEDENGPGEGFRKHVENIVKRWGDPNGDGDPSDGIDGWRLDVAEKVSLEFWKDFRKWVKGVNPNAYIVGEVWWEDFGQNKIFDASDWLAGDAFDAVMNYRFGDAMLKAFVDTKPAAKPSELDKLLGFVRENYNIENQYVLQNLMDSHDTERFASMMKNPNRCIDHGANMNYESGFSTRKPNEAEKDLQKIIIAFQFTYLGAPFIYYGDEVGMWGADDPDCRKPMLWLGINYEAETIDSKGKPQEPDVVEIDNDLLNYYKEIIKLHNDNSCLSTGELKIIEVNDENGFYVFERYDDNDRFLMVFHLYDNKSKLSKSIKLKKWETVASLNYDNKMINGKGYLVLRDKN